MTVPADLADETYLSLTTYRKTGVPVSTAVWAARDGDALVVTTTITTGKVKRLRNNPRVELRPSDRTGKVEQDAPAVAGVAEIVTDEARQTELRKSLAAKYGWQYRLITLFGGRKRRESSCILRITPVEAPNT